MRRHGLIAAFMLARGVPLTLALLVRSQTVRDCSSDEVGTILRPPCIWIGPSAVVRNTSRKSGPVALLLFWVVEGTVFLLCLIRKPVRLFLSFLHLSCLAVPHGVWAGLPPGGTASSGAVARRESNG
jgi:hypothetical protein